MVDRSSIFVWDPSHANIVSFFADFAHKWVQIFLPRPDCGRRSRTGLIEESTKMP